MKWIKLSCFLVVVFAIGGTEMCFADKKANVVEIKDFPRGLAFFTKDARKVLPEQTVAYYNWPTEEELRAKLVTEGNAVSKAKTSSVRWIKKVFKRKWIPKDIENRLIALNDKANGHDQTRARYMIDKHAIQIIQNTAMISILVQQVGKTPVKGTIKQQQLVKAAVQAFLNEDEKICKISCSNATYTWYGLVAGRPIKTEIKDSGIHWWGHTHWKTDGQTVIFTILKFDGGPAEPSCARDWF